MSTRGALVVLLNTFFRERDVLVEAGDNGGIFLSKWWLQSLTEIKMEGSVCASIENTGDGMMGLVSNGNSLLMHHEKIYF